jgi:hypothetical protein
MDRPVVADILPDDRTDENIGQNIVYTPLSGEVVMYGFMKEKLDKCDRVAEEKPPSKNADKITCQRRTAVADDQQSSEDKNDVRKKDMSPDYEEFRSESLAKLIERQSCAVANGSLADGLEFFRDYVVWGGNVDFYRSISCHTEYIYSEVIFRKNKDRATATQR